MTHRPAESEALDHPPIEDLAAFIDGALAEEECVRIRAHLSRCAECYEVFAETVRFQREEEEEAAGEEAEVLPFRERIQERPWRERPRFRLGWAAAAAAAVLVLAVGPAVYRRVAPGSAERPAAEIVAMLPASEASSLMGDLWPRAQRGEGEEEISFEAQSFRLGVEAVNLQASLAAGDRERSREAAARLGFQLASFPGVDEALVHRFQEIADSGPDRPLAEMRRAASEAEEGLDQEVPLLHTLYLAFGRWTEAGRLAALAGEPGLLAERETRRFFERLLEEEHERLAQDGVADEIAQIQEILSRGEIGAAEYERLASSFERILANFYGA